MSVAPISAHRVESFCNLHPRCFDEDKRGQPDGKELLETPDTYALDGSDPSEWIAVRNVRARTITERIEVSRKGGLLWR
jgi:hypothetical protein